MNLLTWPCMDLMQWHVGRSLGTSVYACSIKQWRSLRLGKVTDNQDKVLHCLNIPHTHAHTYV